MTLHMVNPREVECDDPETIIHATTHDLFIVETPSEPLRLLAWNWNAWRYEIRDLTDYEDGAWRFLRISPTKF